MATQPTTYRHTQWGPWCLLLLIIGALMVTLAVFLWGEPFVPFILGISGSLMFLSGTAFCYLTVADEGDRLAIRFGPMPLFQTSIRYEDIESVEVGKTTLLDGFGIHLSLRGGWVWNIWGYDCVVIQHRGITRLGTDDADNLAAFLRTRLPVAAPD